MLVLDTEQMRIYSTNGVRLVDLTPRIHSGCGIIDLIPARPYHHQIREEEEESIEFEKETPRPYFNFCPCRLDLYDKKERIRCQVLA